MVTFMAGLGDEGAEEWRTRRKDAIESICFEVCVLIIRQFKARYEKENRQKSC